MAGSIDGEMDERKDETVDDENSLSDEELSFLNDQFIYSDELPTFDIKSMSPTGRTPSPIDMEHLLTNKFSSISLTESQDFEENPCMGQDYIPLEDIDAHISSPSDKRSNKSLNLETIFEGVFLETPPSKKHCGSRIAMAKTVAKNSINCLNLDLELSNVENSSQSTQDPFCFNREIYLKN